MLSRARARAHTGHLTLSSPSRLGAWIFQRCIFYRSHQMWIKDEPTRQQYPIILVAFYASFTRVIQQLNLSAEEALFQGTMSHINRRFCPFSLSLSLSLSLTHTHILSPLSNQTFLQSKHWKELSGLSFRWLASNVSNNRDLCSVGLSHQQIH